VESSAEYSRRPGLRSANTADYIKRRTRTKFGEHCFGHPGPAAWNSIPDIKLTVPLQCLWRDSANQYVVTYLLTTDTNKFKNLLKSRLLHLAFDIC